MRKVQEQRKRELIASFVSLLQKMELGTTAAVLLEESQLSREKNVELDVQEILRESGLSERDRVVAVENYCKYSIQNYLREGRIDEALQVYEVIVPLHCPHKIAEFSLLFAQTSGGNQRGVSLLLDSLLERPNVLPQSREAILNFGSQIWFMSLLGSSILLIDCHSNAFVVVGNELRYRKEKIHNEQVSAVAVAPSGEMFASGSRDKSVKVWSKTLVLLHIIDVHKAKVNAVLFFDHSLMVFDLDAIISVHQIDSSFKIQRKSAFKTPAPFVDAKYARMKRKIFGVTNQAGGHINIVNIQKKRIQKILQTEKRIYAIQISSDEKLIFANVASSQIHAYSLTGRHQLMYKLTGFVQVKNLMRMSQGGSEGQYLAVTSEEGTVRIYVIREEYQVVKLIGQSKKSVNCVIWKDDHLYFACDAGNLECWGWKGEQRNGQRRHGINGTCKQ